MHLFCLLKFFIMLLCVYYVFDVVSKRFCTCLRQTHFCHKQMRDQLYSISVAIDVSCVLRTKGLFALEVLARVKHLFVNH